jgi:hypothetical protein
MKVGLIILFSGIIFFSCQESIVITNQFSVFEAQFQKLEAADTINSIEKGWAQGRLYEVESPLLSDSLFYNIIDTSKLAYKRWDERLYAEGKIKLDENRTGFFVARQYEDITYDRTTLLLIFNKGVFEKEIIFSEFVGYESTINEIQSKLFKNEKNDWAIIRETHQSTYNYEPGKRKIERFVIEYK